MKANRSPYSKIKITASLDPTLIREIDSYIDKNKTLSRSQFIEDLLRHFSYYKRVTVTALILLTLH